MTRKTRSKISGDVNLFYGDTLEVTQEVPADGVMMTRPDGGLVTAPPGSHWVATYAGADEYAALVRDANRWRRFRRSRIVRFAAWLVGAP